MNATLRHRLQRDGTGWLVLGGALAGLGAYLFQIVGTRALGEADYAPISVLWTIQYLVLSTVLVSIETVVTRDTLAQRERADGAGRQPPRVWRTIVVVAVTLSAVCWLARDALLGGSADLALVVGLMVVSLGAFVIVRGRLAGAGRFKRYGLVTAAESLSRLGFAAVALSLSATVRSLAWILPLGGAVAAWCGRGGRRGSDNPAPTVAPAGLAAGQQATGSGGSLAAITTANVVTQVLLAGGPLVLVVLGASPAEVSIFFVTVTAARVPVVLALGGVLSRLLPTFRKLARHEEGRRLRAVAVQITAAAALLAAVGAAAAAVVGSRVVALLFGATFAPPAAVVAGITAAVVLATAGMLLNQVVVAQEREQRLLVPWLLAVAAAVLTLVVTEGLPPQRVTTAFVVAEVVALAGLLVVVLAPPSRPQPSTR